MIKIEVRNSGVLRMKRSGGTPRGMLGVMEAERDIPFAIKRAYFISGMETTALRGGHAHEKLMQAIFALRGSFSLLLDDGAVKQEIRLDDSGTGVILGPYLWAVMNKFSDDCLIAVFADDYYDEADYMRDYDEFLARVSQKHELKS